MMHSIRVRPTASFFDKKYVYDHPKVTSYRCFTSSRANSTFNTINIAQSYNYHTTLHTALELSCVTMTISDSNNYAYRYYSTDLGRWISRDPLGEKGGMNVYGFVGNATINEYDIFGLAPQVCGIDENGNAKYCPNPPPCYNCDVPPGPKEPDPGDWPNPSLTCRKLSFLKSALYDCKIFLVALHFVNFVFF